MLTGGNDAHQDPCPSHWHYPVRAFEGVTVLAVSSNEAEHRAIKGLFAHTKWVLQPAWSLQEAMQHLDQEPAPVILTSQTLSDGNWSDLLDRIADTPDAPRVIVTTHCLTPDLYEQVVRRGGFDILACPLKASQLYQAVSEAWRLWKCSAGRTLSAFA